MICSSNRYSLASNSDLTHPPSNNFDTSTLDSAQMGAPRQRVDSNALLMLPAPLGGGRPTAMSSTSSSLGVPTRASEDNFVAHSDVASASNQRLIPSPQSPDQYSDSHDSTTVETSYQPVMRQPQPVRGAPAYDPAQMADPFQAVSNQSHEYQAVPVVQSPEPDTYSPYSYSQQSQAQSYSQQMQQQREQAHSQQQTRTPTRGVSLTDGGPVPGPEGVRRVARQQGRRPSSQAPQNRYSRNSGAYNLPPGAAAPQAGYTSS
jgi:chitin synthase